VIQTEIADHDLLDAMNAWRNELYRALADTDDFAAAWPLDATDLDVLDVAQVDLSTRTRSLATEIARVQYIRAAEATDAQR
jgi:hypothetical protein